MSSKLTLSVDEQITRRAKRYARRRGTSISQMVEHFLDAVTSPPTDAAHAPILRRLRGSLRGAGKADHRRYLGKKYR